MCRFGDGATVLEYGNKCLKLVDDVITGYLHLATVANGVETFIEQPVPFSCTPPDAFVLYSIGTYGIGNSGVTTSGGSHLHQLMTAPNSKIAVYDLTSHAETTQV